MAGMGYALRQSEHKPVARMSLEEFLDREERAARRHFYLAGEAVAMAGGSRQQDTIITNIARRGGNALDGKPCRMQGTNILVKLGASDDVVYTDGLITCGEQRYLPHRRDKQLVLLNPIVVFEVLSDSTREFDRTEKFDGYRAIASLEEYVLVEQEGPRVEVFRRMGEGIAWKMTPYASLDATVRLESVGIELEMRQIYEDVRFGPPARENA
jgi:Uma2 family endonuclease